MMVSPPVGEELVSSRTAGPLEAGGDELLPYGTPERTSLVIIRCLLVILPQGRISGLTPKTSDQRFLTTDQDDYQAQDDRTQPPIAGMPLTLMHTGGDELLPYR